jgi:tripartite-type tricarboxylate transporter receptor subunit TctC
MDRRAFLQSAVCLLAATTATRAEQWPSRPIMLIVPFAGGSTSDIFARIVGTEIGKALGTQFVVENRPGGAGNIGMSAAARAAPDGYTLAVGTNAQLAINVGLFAKLPFDPVKDFAPIMPMVESFNGLIVPKSSPARSVAELIDLIRAKPGALDYSSGGIGTTHHLSAALFCAKAGVEALHVPYRGAPEGVNAVMTGQVAFGFFNLPNVVPLAKAGELRILAVTGAKRSPLMPEVKTMQEEGVADYVTSVWFGLYAPIGAPRPALEKLRAAAADLMQKPQFAAHMGDIGFEVMPVRNTEDSSAFLKSEITKWVSIVRLSGAKVD